MNLLRFVMLLEFCGDTSPLFFGQRINITLAIDIIQGLFRGMHVVVLRQGDGLIVLVQHAIFLHILFHLFGQRSWTVSIIQIDAAMIR